MFQVEWKGVERQTTDEVEHFHALDKQFTVVIETKKRLETKAKTEFRTNFLLTKTKLINFDQL